MRWSLNPNLDCHCKFVFKAEVVVSKDLEMLQAVCSCCVTKGQKIFVFGD